MKDSDLDSDYDYLSNDEYHELQNEDPSLIIQTIFLNGSNYKSLSPDDKLLLDNEFYVKYFSQIEELFNDLQEWAANEPKKKEFISALTLDKLYMFLLTSSNILHSFIEQDVGVSEGK